jgi:hypothetical protein
MFAAAQPLSESPCAPVRLAAVAAALTRYVVSAACVRSMGDSVVATGPRDTGPRARMSPMRKAPCEQLRERLRRASVEALRGIDGVVRCRMAEWCHA